MSSPKEPATGQDAGQKGTEHYVTLFDRRFLPQGLSLIESLQKQSRSFRLWVLCLDEETEAFLSARALKGVQIIPLREMETKDLLSVKGNRSAAEYCWTLTPFSFSEVFQRDPAARRVTYVDADIFFFGDPVHLLEELDRAGKGVLITEHAYDPAFDLTARFGRFCVQFVTFDRSPRAQELLRRWQAQCLEWCYARYDVPGRFGDQMYLDEWPEKFGDAVHVLQDRAKALGPWNVRYYLKEGTGSPVFYHFHGFRIVARHKAQLYAWFCVGQTAQPMYEAYVSAVSRHILEMEAAGIPLEPIPLPAGLRAAVRRWMNRLKGRFAWATLP